MKIDPIILLEIILSAVTLIITIFLAILGIIAFWGWRNLKDIEEKQKIFLTQRQKILDEAKVAIKESKEEANEIIESLKKEKRKAELPAKLKEQNKEIEGLIDRLNNAIDSAESRVGSLRATGITSTSSVLNSTPLSGYNVGNYISSFGNEKKCSYCGKIYYSDITSLNNRCPYCGNFNY